MRTVRERARLVRRMATDRRMPLRWRIALWALLAYLASPIDLIPDFIPVLGQLDDVLIAGLVLRGALKAAPPEFRAELDRAASDRPRADPSR